jgi:hypothetical protein
MVFHSSTVIACYTNPLETYWYKNHFQSAIGVRHAFGWPPGRRQQPLRRRPSGVEGGLIDPSGLFRAIASGLFMAIAQS